MKRRATKAAKAREAEDAAAATEPAVGAPAVD